MAKLKAVIETNIVAIYPTLDLRAVDVNAIGKIGELENDTYGNTFLVGNKAVKLIMPQTKIEIEIAENRLKIADLLGKKPDESDIVKRYLVSVNNLLTPYKSSIYGFNFVVDLDTESDLKILADKFYGLIPGTTVKAQEASMLLQSTDTSYTIKLAKKIDKVYQLIFNKEINGNADNMETIQANFVKSYQIMEEVVNGI